MAAIHSVTTENGTYLIEPKLFAVAGGSASALTAAISNFELYNGALVYIKINTVNANATLNVNNIGAKNIYYNNLPIRAELLQDGGLYTLIYDGTQWNVIGDLASDTRIPIIRLDEE